MPTANDQASGGFHNRLREDWRTGVAVVLSGAALAGLATHQLAMNGTDFGAWDYMLLSGSLTTLCGLWFARAVPERYEAMLARLGDRGALFCQDEELTAGEVETLKDELEERGGRWSLRAAFVVAAGGAVIWGAVVIARDDQPLFDQFAGPAVGFVGGFFVGLAIGRMVAYSLLNRELRARGIALRPNRGHPDGAAGLKPLGDFYLFQALLLALPAVYLLAWSLVMIDSGMNERYAGWREAYLGFLALAIILEITAFVAPLQGVHATMSRAKAKERKRADTETAPQIAALRQELEKEPASPKRAELKDRLEQLTNDYREAEAMPTWPLDEKLRRRVTIGNLALLLPLASQVIKLAD